MPIYEGAQKRHSHGWIKWLLLAALLGGGGFVANQFVPRHNRQAEQQQAEEPKAPMAESDYYRDYSKSFPWFPALKASISPTERQVMDKLRAMPQYNSRPLAPIRSGTMAATMDELERRVAETLALKVDAKTGALTGRPLVYTGDRGPSEPDKTKPANFITDFYPLFNDALIAYEGTLPEKKGAPDDTDTKALRARAATLLSRVLTHFANQPLDGIRSGGKSFDTGYGYVWAKDGGKGRRMLSAMALLDKPAVRANFLENLIWMQGGIGASQGAGLSTDEYLNTTPQHLAAISLMQDSPAKWQRLLMVRYAMENSILVANPSGTVSPDGGVIHHGYAHNAYASYEFASMCKLLRDLNDCGVPSLRDADEVARRVARAGIAWAWIHQPSKIVTNIEGRPGAPFVAQLESISKPGADDFAIDSALTLLSYKCPATWREDATRLPATALAKNPDAKIPSELEPFRDAAKAVTGTLTGSLAYPVAGAILQRRKGWLVSVRGTPAHRLGGEGMPYGSWGERNTFGGLYCKGSLMLVADGATPDAPADLISSGQAMDGRDMSLMPGVTAPILPWEKMVGSFFGIKSSLAAPVALDGQGVWGFAADGFAKSCFLFENRITYATVVTKVNTKAPSKDAPPPPLATTFIQFRHMDGAVDPEYFDGKLMQAPAQLTIEDSKPHTLLATGGHAYYLHPTTETLHLFRREQENHFIEKAKSKTEQPTPEDAKTYKGNFTTGYWTHKPEATQRDPVVFTLLVKAGVPGLVDFSNRMKTPATAPVRLTISETAHIMYDADTRMWGAVFFAAGPRGSGHERNAECPVLAADRPCSVAIKGDRTSLTVAVAGSEEIKDPTPFTLTMKGSWRLADGNQNASVSNASSAGETLLVVNAAAPAGNPVRLVPR